MPNDIAQHALDALTRHIPDATDIQRQGVRLVVTSSQPDYHREYLYRSESLPATQLVGEAESLKRINEACKEAAPILIGSGTDERENEWMLCEWHDLSPLPYAEQPRLAELLAGMHLAPTPSADFGFPIATNCGVTVQDNTPEPDWATFWSERRLGDMPERIGDDELKRVGREVQQRVIPHLLAKLDIQPSLLHGDLWSGNARYSRDRSAPVIFDPASYYGHSEADLGIMRMFGGFSDAFFQRYHELVPKSEPVDEYEQRLQLYEAYHHLNHTLMFGNSYKRGAMSLLTGLIRWADERGL